MLQVELRINGVIVDYVDVVNVTDSCNARPKLLDMQLYEVRHQGNIFGFAHKRSDGVRECAKAALEAIKMETPSPRVMDVLLSEEDKEINNYES
jgi:hypothetical protein